MIEGETACTETEFEGGGNVVNVKKTERTESCKSVSGCVEKLEMCINGAQCLAEAQILRSA